ncbi:unnamed protein product [Rotaria magnacalcarata]|uniref:ETS domain-containing protein n=1 Tax=Rotaria magnacalcarata TaxID=392030 RepID=A0A815EE58_9BILA|nr:unnamed protein product [Rotaria magnacalcarata]CAF1348511.1 unnamed protein product [Rotaria magnacalcarata]CAF1988321.1 unnamed protein product [Rotaria magnacalcarata]CAF2055292.1 unnamed protein product [Rotaria magnacalcarata]CAF4211712.1 unnamed protein product [Rotaria magnacalcarata]
MCDDQESPIHSPFVVDSLEALFEFIDSIDLNELNFDESDEKEINKVYKYLLSIDMHPSEQPPAVSDSATNFQELMCNQQSPPMCNQQSPPMCRRVENMNENDPAAYFDRNYFLINDTAASKIRPPKLCEFLLLILSNPIYHSYASWTNEDSGVFKIHEPEKLASLWRRVKVRQTSGLMDYETFSRSIRYYYKSGLMLQTHKRHTYRFAKK